MRRAGSARPEATSAALTRSLASVTALSGADDVQGRKSRRDLDLNIDGARLDALERNGRNPLDHAQPCLAAEISGSLVGHKNNSGTLRSGRAPWPKRGYARFAAKHSPVLRDANVKANLAWSFSSMRSQIIAAISRRRNS